ncbi:MAG: 50S ribosomal protein L21 [Patescibacteria group bacterium]
MSKIAVIKTGGKQYIVKDGETLKVEKMLAEGAMEFNDVLLLADEAGDQVEIGKPRLTMTVKADITKQGRAKKIMVVHYKAKSRYHKKYGHRQPFTEVKVSSVA